MDKSSEVLAREELMGSTRSADNIKWSPELVAVLYQAGYSGEKIMAEVQGERGKITTKLLHDLQKNEK